MFCLTQPSLDVSADRMFLFQSENRLLILCRSGHVVEVHSPEPGAQESSKTFKLQYLPRRSFRFKSIKSRIKVQKTYSLVYYCNSLQDDSDLGGWLCFQREEEVTRRQAAKEKKRKEREEKLKQLMEEGMVLLDEEKEEEEEELPPIFIPNPPSPLCCGFYSQPGQFWVSMVKTNISFHVTVLCALNYSSDQNDQILKWLLVKSAQFCSSFQSIVQIFQSNIPTNLLKV